MFLPRLMGNPTRQTRATAAATLFNPARVPNIEPIGVQYDRNFGLPAGWLPTGSISSPLELQLKMGSGNAQEVPGNFYPLALSNATGADNYRGNMDYGSSQAYQVGDVVQTETGNMVGPTTQALDDRISRASDPRFTGDTWTDFHPDNPHVVYFPLVNWLQVSQNGRADIEILGFAAFWITHYNGGQIYGRFVRMVIPGATEVPGVTTFDAGLYSAKLTE
jgi:hypothetical protein